MTSIMGSTNNFKVDEEKNEGEQKYSWKKKNMKNKYSLKKLNNYRGVLNL